MGAETAASTGSSTGSSAYASQERLPEALYLQLRKQRLRLRIAQQRVACLGVLHEVETAVSTFDKARNLVSRVGALLREHAALGAALGGVLLLWRPRGPLRWLRRGWLLWLALRRNQSRLGGWLRIVTKLAGLAGR